MNRIHWMYILLALFASAFHAQIDEIDDNDYVAKDSKPTYTPIQFAPPDVVGWPHFVDWFQNRDAIGRTWIKSHGKKDDVEDSLAKYNGEWEIGPPSKIAIQGDNGLIVKTKARHHAVAAKFSRKFEFIGKPLIAQYEVKYEEGQECGGGYMKLLSAGVEENIKEFTDKTPYTIMFGPDKCGPSSKIHFIIRLKSPKSAEVQEHHAKQQSKSVSAYFDSHKTHLYTLIVRPDETFAVLVDNSQVMSGSLLKDMEPSVVPPEKVDDENDKKSADWDEREKIDDANARKPDDWDENAPREIEDEAATKPGDWLEDEESKIHDPSAVKPSDWDEEMDGTWEAPKIDNPKCVGVSGCGLWKRPMIANPAYKGKWKRPVIANPNYKGKWSPKQIENPNYYEPHPFSQLEPITAIGFELWTMSSNIIIDNIYVGDDERNADSFQKQTFAIKTVQEERYESATTESDGILSKIVSATEERPWLWAVYIISVLIPVIIIAIMCFGRKSRPSTCDYKKTDEPQMDDEDDAIPNLVGDDDYDEIEEMPKAEVEKEETKPLIMKRASSRSSSRGRGKQSDLKKSEEDHGSTGDSEEVDTEYNSQKTRRLRQRKQD